MPIHASFRGVWGTFLPNNVPQRPNPKKDHPWAEPRYLSRKRRKSVARFELGVGTRKNRQGRTGKKSQKGYISPICGGVPTKAMYIKICLVGDVLDIITCARFQSEIFRGYDFTVWSNFPFSLWFLNGPYNSAALMCCLWSSKQLNYGTVQETIDDIILCDVYILVYIFLVMTCVLSCYKLTNMMMMMISGTNTNSQTWLSAAARVHHPRRSSSASVRWHHGSSYKHCCIVFQIL